MPDLHDRDEVDHSPSHIDAPLVTGALAVQVVQTGILNALEAQQSIARYWLLVGTEWASFVGKVSSAHMQSWPTNGAGDVASNRGLSADAARQAWNDYLEMTERVVDRGGEAGRELVTIFGRQADGARSLLSNGSRLS